MSSLIEWRRAIVAGEALIVAMLLYPPRLATGSQAAPAPLPYPPPLGSKCTFRFLYICGPLTA